MNTLAPTDPAKARARTAPLQLRTAYAICRHRTRSAARNFYYAFLVLPRRKRDALSAVYAFMRQADDISDDPAVPLAERRARLSAWLDALHQVVSGSPTDDPVLMALEDTQRRFKIPLELLEKLVQGTAMDLAVSEVPPARGGAPQVLYRTFDDLYQYCYHVASVVGLVCIRVFGYRDTAAEALAERCGVAFQLTNIIRDVNEDASMGRIYLPQEDLDRFGVSALMFASGGDVLAMRRLLAWEAQRAREFYRSGRELVPLVDEDCRAALWTLVEIYSRLLEKIASNDFDVFKKRVRLTAGEKLRILAKGLWRRLRE